jgi:hypothetical protein
MTNKSELKTFTEEQVNNIIANVRFKEQVISAMMTAIQRSIAAGDGTEYTNALRSVLAAQMPQPPPKEPDEKKPEDTDSQD